MLLPVALPILILIVPLADLVLAVVRRTRAGRSPFAPDKQHLHHRLLEIGHSHRRAVVDHVDLGRPDRASPPCFASLRTGTVVWVAIGAGVAATLLLTFVLPVVHRPAILRDAVEVGAVGGPETL